MDIIDLLTKGKKAMSAIAMIRGIRWIRPSETKDYADCAVLQVDLEVPPERIAQLGMGLIVLRKMNPAVDTDHPIFKYMGEQQEAGQNALVTATISITRTPKEKKRKWWSLAAEDRLDNGPAD